MTTKNDMYYYVNHKYKDSIIAIIKLFYFNEKVVEIENNFNGKGIFIQSLFDGNTAICRVYKDNKEVAISTQNIDDKNENLFSNEEARIIKLTVFYALSQINKIHIPWGILTGIRPTKKIGEMLENGINELQIKKFLQEKYLADEDKIQLAIDISKSERSIIKDNNSNKISVYIGIPFCPTRCIYCSFTSFSMASYNKNIDNYLQALKKEMLSIKNDIKNYEIENIYIGGGTPTSLDENRLESLLYMINDTFNTPKFEYTIEAGRADTITRKKLKIIKEYGINRICINPQTLNDETLIKIGRNHLEKDYINGFNLAREEGFLNINSDIILGLDGEGIDHIKYTMEGLQKLSPESITVHTLALKRASTLKENITEYNKKSFLEMEQMVKLANKYAKEMNFLPYYMYKQKSTIGNFENVGYCKIGFESRYNIQIMEEKQTIISFGAGATSKFYFENMNSIKRVFNIKGVEEYVKRIDEMIQRKKEMIFEMKEGAYEKSKRHE